MLSSNETTEISSGIRRPDSWTAFTTPSRIRLLSAKIAVGLTLDEIRIANTPASFEPTLDYIVTKVARFPFDKFSDASNKLGTQMKATGEVEVDDAEPTPDETETGTQTRENEEL